MLTAIETPALAIADRSRAYARRIGAGTRFRERDRARAIAEDGGMQPALRLRRGALEYQFIDVPERTADKDIGRAAKLLLRDDGIEGGETAAAVLLRHVHRVKTERPGLFEDALCRLGREHTRALDLLFERL